MPTAPWDLLGQMLGQMLSVSATVALLLALTRHGGTLIAGMATAALSVPTLLLLAVEHGPAFARWAAIGTLLTTPTCAAGATLGLRWLHRRAAAQRSPHTTSLQNRSPQSGSPRNRSPHEAAASPVRRPLGGGRASGVLRLGLAVLMAGAVSAGVCASARRLGPLGSGFVGGLPWVAGWTLLGTQRHSGAEAARRYVAAYRRALWPRGAVVLVFALLAVPLGAVGALLCALGAGGALLCALRAAGALLCALRAGGGLFCALGAGGGTGAVLGRRMSRPRAGRRPLAGSAPLAAPALASASASASASGPAPPPLPLGHGAGGLNA